MSFYESYYSIQLCTLNKQKKNSRIKLFSFLKALQNSQTVLEHNT